MTLLSRLICWVLGHQDNGEVYSRSDLDHTMKARKFCMRCRKRWVREVR